MDTILKHPISLFFMLLLAGESLISCIDLQKGAIFKEDSTSSYFLEDVIYNITWKITPEKHHIIRLASERLADNIMPGDTTCLDIQSLFNKKIDHIYFF